MFRKFGLDRSEVFISSRQGIVGDNSYRDAPAELIFEELR